MKKIIFALAILACAQVAYAQGGKSVAAAKAAVEAAKADAQNSKKAEKVATWMTLGKALMTAYNAPAGNAYIGGSRQDLALLMGNEKPQGTENVTFNGTNFVKEIYANKNLYFNESGVLQMIEVTKPVLDNALEEAVKAYAKAATVDPKGTKTKDIKSALSDINTKYTEEAYAKYTMGDMAAASKLFKAAYDAKKTAPLNEVDTLALYNSGFTAQNAGDVATAKAAFEACKNLGYYGEDGDVFAKLAKIAEDSDDKAGQKAILEEGFSKYPSSQAVLIGLINYYVASNEDTNRLFDLLEGAKKNEPTNASLYYVEGNIRNQLGDEEGAIKAYEKRATINRAYEFGFIGEGILFYNKAVAVQEKAQAELDDAKYAKLVEEFEAALKGCIKPFESAFNVTKDDSIKVSVAEYLKNAFYRFRDEDANMKASYDKYSDIVAKGTAQ
ncbi:MAG: hypothetical protein MJZ16_11210 [Bacteroidales bacterium]|nr:hypothetical protein [Bacteroidales bacterium]